VWISTILQKNPKTFPMFFNSLLHSFYSKTNQMHQCLKFILFWNTSTCFGRSFRPSSGVHDCAYSNRHMSKRYCYSLLAGTRWNSRSCYVYILLYVQSWTPVDGWKDRPKRVELFQNKINLRHRCIWLVLLWKYITMHGPMNVKFITCTIFVFVTNYCSDTFRSEFLAIFRKQAKSFQ
jgi:hypothetical protein